VSTFNRIKYYDAPQPKTVETAITTQTLLCAMDCPYPLESTIVGKVLTASPFTQQLATGAGSAAWARLTDGAGATVCDLTVGATGSGANIILDNQLLYPGVLLAVLSCTINEA
jgi:hypothetical protein